MITINLKPGVKRAKAGSSFAGGLTALKDLRSKVKDPWPMAAVAAWVLAIGFLGWVGIGSATTLRRVDEELRVARAENRRFRALIADKRKAQAARDSVVAQIATIRGVDADRYVWPHILDEITRAVPAYTWLTELNTVTPTNVDTAATALPPVGVIIAGKTMDIQGFTRFMRQLEDSPWLGEVALIMTTTEIDHGRAVTVFTVRANYVRQKLSPGKGA